MRLTTFYNTNFETNEDQEIFSKRIKWTRNWKKKYSKNILGIEVWLCVSIVVTIRTLFPFRSCIPLHLTYFHINQLTTEIGSGSVCVNENIIKPVWPEKKVLHFLSPSLSHSLWIMTKSAIVLNLKSGKKRPKISMVTNDER